jgi:DNA (cytosine-5)-methyltransferase 1
MILLLFPACPITGNNKDRLSKSVPEEQFMPSAKTEFAILREQAALSEKEAAQFLRVTPKTISRYETRGDGGTTPDKLKLDFMRTMAAANAKNQSPTKTRFRFIDLFAGIGGLRKPFEEIGGECIFTSEWDRYSQQTYAANFHDNPFTHKSVGDIRPFADDPSMVPDHDVLLAGFPCQPFSIAGVSKKNSLGRPHGFLCNTQGTLFHDLAKIIDYHRPAAFLLENVKNLEGHDGGKTFATIMHVLEEELGYNVQYRIIGSEPWVPQKRQRIFIVGFRDATNFSFDDLIVPQGRSPVLGDILEKQVPEKYTLTKHLWNYLQDYKAKHALAGNGFGFSVFGPKDVSRTLSARYYKDGSECLISQGRQVPRRLTPRECARLMGFDTPEGSDFKIPVSDTQAYRQFGNAVVVPVVRAVAEAMSPHIRSDSIIKDTDKSLPASGELIYG